MNHARRNSLAGASGSYPIEAGLLFPSQPSIRPAGDILMAIGGRCERSPARQSRGGPAGPPGPRRDGRAARSPGRRPGPGSPERRTNPQRWVRFAGSDRRRPAGWVRFARVRRLRSGAWVRFAPRHGRPAPRRAGAAGRAWPVRARPPPPPRPARGVAPPGSKANRRRKPEENRRPPARHAPGSRRLSPAGRRRRPRRSVRPP